MPFSRGDVTTGSTPQTKGLEQTNEQGEVAYGPLVREFRKRRNDRT